MYQAFKEMPTLLKFITAHALACFVFFLAAVVPGISINFNGEVIESQQLWAKGLGLPIIVVGLAMPGIGLLFLRRWQYCRQVYSVAFVSVMVGPFLYWQELPSTIFGVVISCGITGYLFINGQVSAYFSS